MTGVERLTGLDAGFLYMETPRQHMHTLKIAVVDPATAPGGYSFERLHDVLRERLHLLPPFRRRVVEVPLRLHHPVWVEDADFDLRRHLRRTVASPPGSSAQFDAVISEIAGHPLDRRRPLWELWVVEGLADGRVGFVAKIHHAAADGVRAAELLMNVVDAVPDADGTPSRRHTWRPEPVPSRRALLMSALAERARQVRALPQLLARTMTGLWRAARQRRERSSTPPPLPFAAPNVAVNRALTPRRRFASCTVSFEDAKSVRRACGVTVNDVVLAICTGALRRWLLERGELPARPLVAGVPVSTRPEEHGEVANRVSNLFTALPVDVQGPLERLRAVHEVMRGAKKQHNLLGADMLADWAEISPPGPFAGVVRLYSRLRVANLHRPPINLVVSNVPGPRQPLYVAGARITGIWSVGPILENVGLNITVWSYLDRLNVGMLACADAAPDLDRLAAFVPDALDELLRAATERAAIAG
jgi:diacylglycerol O-acyltransferase